MDQLTVMLDGVFLGNSLRDWVLGALLFLVVLSVLRFGRRQLERRLGAVAAQTHNILDDLVLDLVRQTKWFFPLAVALLLGTRPLTTGLAADTVIRAVLMIALLVQAAVWGNALASQWITRHMEERMADDAAAATTVGALRFLSRLVLWTIALLVALDNLGIDVTALVTGLGIGGIAVALALQNVLGDLFASLSIVLDQPFVIGDFIVVGDHMGSVEYIGLKTTRLRSLSGEQLIFSNADLLGSRIRNYKRMAERRVLFSFGVVYQTPRAVLETIPGMVREIIEGIDKTRFDRAHFKAFGDSSLDFEAVYYVLDAAYNAYMDIQQAINLELYRRFEADGIEFAYPTRTVYMREETAS